MPTKRRSSSGRKIVKTQIWCIARNSRGRPMLFHRVEGYRDIETMCGVYIADWNREWSAKPLHVLLACRRCAKK